MNQSNQPQGNDQHQLPAFMLPPQPTAARGSGARPGSMAYRARLAMVPQPEMALKCPRCDSTNTKFCYFNNYSLTQPRHFCKTCRRYWTRGGALRNVPVGGGFRKNNKKKKKSHRSKSPIATQIEMGKCQIHLFWFKFFEFWIKKMFLNYLFKEIQEQLRAISHHNLFNYLQFHLSLALEQTTQP